MPASAGSVSSRPIVTLMSDFGTRDFYVPAMKAVLVGHCDSARMIDITHEIPRHDILCGSITLERAVDGFPAGTVHLAVVDPGVGTDRKLLVVRINRQTVVCPDNGLITWAWRRLGKAVAHELVWRPRLSSHTFHGRDIMAPAAGMLACGRRVSELARPLEAPVLLDLAPAPPGARAARVIHVDHFGNATTNVSYEAMEACRDRIIRIRARSVGKLKRTYFDVAPGEPLALIGSSGLLEIAVRDGSAAKDLKLKVGDPIKIG